MEILSEYIPDKNVLGIMKEIINSFCSYNFEIGLPLGNLTSQLFANVYLNKFDQFVKHKLKIKYYIRYADDFVILSESKIYLEKEVPIIRDFFQKELKLTLHPDKIFIKTLFSGMDYLGWVNFFDHRILRTKTRKRIFKMIKKNASIKTLNSYLGLLKHGNSCKIKESILNSIYNKII